MGYEHKAIVKEIEKDNLIRERLAKGRGSAFRTYIDLTVGMGGISRFLLYELLTSFLRAS